MDVVRITTGIVIGRATTLVLVLSVFSILTRSLTDCIQWLEVVMRPSDPVIWACDRRNLLLVSIIRPEEGLCINRKGEMTDYG